MPATPPQTELPQRTPCVRRKGRGERLALAALLIFFGALYGSTLYPTFGGRLSYGDSVKWQMMAYVKGTVHSPGYPLWLLLLQAWGRLLPFVEPALRITLLAPVCVLIALVVIYRVAARLTPSRAGRLLAPLVLGTTSVLWIQATEIEVYALNLVFVGLVCGCLIAWRQTRHERYFFAGMLIYALSFAHHLTMITLLPGVAWLVLVTEPQRFKDLRTIGIVAAFIALGFSPYFYLLYLSYSDAPWHEWLGQRATFPHFLRYITGGQFADSLASAGLRQHLAHSTRRFVSEGLYNLRLPGLLLAGIALLRLPVRWRRHEGDWAPHGFLALILGGELAFGLYYKISDIEAYYLPVYLAMVLLSVAEIGAWRRRGWRIAGWLVLIGIAAVNLGRYDALKVCFDPRSEEMTYVIEHLPDGATFYVTKQGLTFLYTKTIAIEYVCRVMHPEKRINFVFDMPPQHDFYFLPYHLEAVLAEKRYAVEAYLPAFDLQRVLDQHAGDTVILCTRGKAGPGLPPFLCATLARQGIRLGELEERGAYAAVLDRGQVVAQGIRADGVVKLEGAGLKRLGIDRVESAGAESGDAAKIRVGGRDCSPNRTGLNVVALDAQGQVKARYTIDTVMGDRVWTAILHAVPKQ